MLTTGKESREFLYADDCCLGIETIMKKHNKFKKQKNELHLTTGKKIKILEIAQIIKKISKSYESDISIVPGKKYDNVQLNKNNINNKYLMKFWKPSIDIRTGIETMYNYYRANKKIKFK